VGTKSGFKIFSTDPFQLFYESSINYIKIECGPISIVEMLYTTNLIVLVGLADFGDFSPKRVTVWSTSQNIVLCSSSPFISKINMAKINKARMIIGERNFIHIYATGNMKILHTIDVGIVNLGKLVLSPSSDKNNYVCYSSSIDEGIVKVYDLLYLSLKTTIKAHKSPILKISINYKGDLLATCSCKGTIIRVFNLPKGEKVITFKRGISSAYIFCLNFSFDNEKLVSSSDTGTLHIFDLKQESLEYYIIN
jgi:autophagy-related protein 18